MENATPGIHHITAIAGDAQKNLDFYSGVLGLRLVKKTVNYDDPGTYHLYYGDRNGLPEASSPSFPGLRRGSGAGGDPDRSRPSLSPFPGDRWGSGRRG